MVRLAKKEEEINTTQLFKLLHSTAELSPVLESISNSPDISLTAMLEKLLCKYSLTIAQMIEKAVLSKAFGYQIFNGTRRPGRDILLRIAVVMKLSVEETQRLLTVARHGRLYPKIRRDAAIIFSIQNKYTLEQSCELLDGIGELPLL